MEKSEAARQEEQQRKTLEAKAAAFEKQVLQLQVSSGAATSVPVNPARQALRVASLGPPFSAVTVTAVDPGRAGAGTLDLGLVSSDTWSA